MMAIFDYIKDNVVYLLSLWADQRVADMIGANFLYIILSIWLTWLVVNMFIIRPVSGSLFGDMVNVSTGIRAYVHDKYAAWREKRASQRYYRRHSTEVTTTNSNDSSAPSGSNDLISR